MLGRRWKGDGMRRLGRMAREAVERPSSLEVDMLEAWMAGGRGRQSSLRSLGLELGLGLGLRGHRGELRAALHAAQGGLMGGCL